LSPSACPSRRRWRLAVLRIYVLRAVRGVLL